MNKRKFKITEKQLLETYVGKILTAPETGILFGCSRSTVLNRLRELDIHIRTKSEVLRLRPRKFKITEEELYNLYWNKNMTTYEIGEMFGVSAVTVGNRLREFNILIRDAKENFKHIRFVGKDNFNYIDGRTPLYESIRKSPSYKNWQKGVLKKDDYTCQECNQRGGDLEAHHKKPYAVILQEFLTKYDNFSPLEERSILFRLAMKYEPFWDLDNGETLCLDCHNEKTTITVGKIKESRNE